MKLINPTFFSRNKKSGELKIGDRNRRKLLIELLENNELLSIPQLSAKSQVPRTDTREIIETFVKSLMVKPIKVAEYQGRKDFKYELTNIGILYAIAVKVSEHLPLGDKIKDILVRVFQPERGSPPINRFMFTVLINAVNRDLIDYVVRFITNIIEISETTSEPNLWKIAEKGVNEAKPSETKGIGDATIQTLNGFQVDEKNIVVQYFRNMFINKLFQNSVIHGNMKLQTLLTMSQEDKDAVYMEFRHSKCGYINEQYRVPMEILIIQVFTGGLECPKCGRLVKEQQNPRKGFRNHSIKIHAK